jgi:hypothetical protein
MLLAFAHQPETGSWPECPDELVLAAFLDGGLPEDRRTAINAHVADCPRCLARLGTVVGSRTTDPGAVPAAWIATAIRGRTRWQVPNAFAAAAVLLLVAGAGLLWPIASPRNAAEDDDLARPAPMVREARDRDPILRILLPPEGTMVGDRPLTVRWTPVARAEFYEVRLLSDAGAGLWSTQTTESALVVPANAFDAPAPVVFLLVDAYLPEGRRLSSPVVKLQRSH